METFGKLNQPCFISSACSPLKDIVKSETDLSIEYGFSKECSGNCGV